MKLQSLKCPNCNAETPLATGVKMAFCEYCGSRVFMPEKENPQQPATPPHTANAQSINTQAEKAFAAGQFADAGALWQRMCTTYPTEWEGWYGMFKITAATEMQAIKAQDPQALPQPYLNNPYLQKAFAYMPQEKLGELQALVSQHDGMLQSLRMPSSKRMAMGARWVFAGIGAALVWLFITLSISAIANSPSLWGILILVGIFGFIIVYNQLSKKYDYKNKMHNISYQYMPQNWQALYNINSQIIRFNLG